MALASVLTGVENVARWGTSPNSRASRGKGSPAIIVAIVGTMLGIALTFTSRIPRRREGRPCEGAGIDVERLVRPARTSRRFSVVGMGSVTDAVAWSPCEWFDRDDGP
jgi:hypothetical protein